jgi:hypothetical protein
VHDFSQFSFCQQKQAEMRIANNADKFSALTHRAALLGASQMELIEQGVSLRLRRLRGR